MKYLISFLLFGLAVQQGQGQLQHDSIQIDGIYRHFRFIAPAAGTKASNLMFILHGSGGDGMGMVKPAQKLQAMAKREQLLIIYPDAYQRFWNECRKFSNAQANKQDINEQAFFIGMIQYAKTSYGIDEKKVFAAGFSGGGQMVYKLALTIPGTIKAITAIVANLPDNASMDCVPVGKPIPVMIINGTLDNVNPYKGGEMFVNNASFGVVLSSYYTQNYWAKLAGYKGHPAVTWLPDTDTTDSRIIKVFTYKKKRKPEIVLMEVIGGQHDYPRDIDVYTEAWKFFKRQ